MPFLTRDDVAFLKAELDLSSALNKELEKINGGGEIRDDDADDLRDLCTEYLAEIGFDESYQVTAKGNVLETLIDKLFVH